MPQTPRALALKISVFPNLQALEVVEYETTFQGLTDWLQALPEYPSKAACPLVSLNRYGAERTEKQSLRSNRNILAATGVIGDYDAGLITPEDAIGIFRTLNISAIIVTTPSHGLKGNRWRILLPFSLEKTPAEKHALIGKANALLGGVLASESFTSSQAFYVGRVVGVEYAVLAHSGDFIDVLPGIEAIDEVGPARATVSQGAVDEFSLLPKRAEGGAAQIREVLSRVANDGHDWEFWNKIGMAVYNASGGSDEGLEAWREWSDTCPGDGDSVDNRWTHYVGSPPTELGMGTLVHLAGGLAPVDTALGDSFGAPALKGTDGQIKWANQIRAQKLLECQGDVAALEALCKRSGPGLHAGFWIDNKDAAVEELVRQVTPVAKASNPLGNLAGPQLAAGYQFLGVSQQIEHFAGCVYIQDLHRIFTPTGAMLDQARFNATYGGYAFQIEADGGGKTTRKAWDAFTESQAVRYPKAAASVFRPEYPSGAIIHEEGLPLVNTYVPIETLAQPGDAGPFIGLVEKLLPDARDRSILLSYMAALVQNPGRKFQWWPVLQGVKGNGKTLLVSALTHAVGSRYTHCPNVDEMAKSGNKFNGWIRNRLFIGMEEVYVSKRRDFLESFKTTVTNIRLPIENKGIDQIMGDNRANGFMCTNHRDGVPVDDDERRYGIFFTAQQTAADLQRDGMGGRYFPDLYDWCLGRGEYANLGPNYGYGVINHYLQTYQVAEEFNPAGQCQRAPQTSSTLTAINESRGSIEQEVLEAVDEGRQGFAGGWISSKALDGLLQQLKAESKIPRNKRRELLQAIGYDWHPALHNGRVNNYVTMDAGKPVLFIKTGHIHAQLSSAAEVVRFYEQAQNARIAATGAGAAFN